MSEKNKVVVRRYLEEVWNARNPGLIAELVAESFIDHHLPPELPSGPAGVDIWYNAAVTAFPDCHITREDVIAEGDKVVTRFTFSGTHRGEFMGIPATGKQFSITAIAIARIADGKLVEWWENADVMGLMQQLGALPAPEAA
jgi:steroid delta-isomerase-like uncharacterized protein